MSFRRAQSPTDCESGYSSATNSDDSFEEVYFSRAHLKHINAHLANLEPEDILRWCVVTLPGLFQTTAFGLTGLVTIDILSKITQSSGTSVDLIFLDTLYHFNETLDLVENVQSKYPNIRLHAYRPQNSNTAADFENAHGQKLWETDDTLYDYLVKVEPAQRAYAELKVKAVITGRRKSQGGKRGDLDIIEIDEAGLIKVNPLANWSFAQVKQYIDQHNVPYNVLLDRGYKSVGDWHSTAPVAEGEDERSGRWKGQDKSECGIHNSQSKYYQYLMELERKKKEQLEESLRNVHLEQTV